MGLCWRSRPDSIKRHADRNSPRAASFSEVPMIPIDLSGKVALVSGVGDNQSFAWFISKTFKAAGAKIVLACHPRVVGIVEGLLRSSQADDVDARKMPDGSDFQPAKILPCDASYDTMDDVPPEVKNDRRYAKFPEYSIQGTIDAVAKEFGGIDILIHSIAFSREVTKPLIDTSRKAYHEAMGISSYSLIEHGAGRGAAHGQPAGRR